MRNSFFISLRRFRVHKTVKRIFNLVGGIFFTACCFFFAYLTFQNGWTNLNKVNKYEGVITEKGVTTYRTSTSGPYRITFTKQAFYLKLKGLNQTLAVYNPKQNYSNLDNRLNVGDTVKVFYNYSNLVDKLNFETFQIEKNNQEILKSRDFQGREQIAFYIVLVGGFVLLFLTFYQDRKFRLKNETNRKHCL